MRRRTRVKLSQVLLKAAELVNPDKSPEPFPFPVRSDPNFQHPFQIPDARNVLFIGSGEQFSRWAEDLSTEVFERTLVFQDRSAWHWQRGQLCRKLSSFFGNPDYASRPALLWTGQYCINFWYGIEESGRRAWEKFVQGWLFPRDGTIPLGYQAAPAGVPKADVAAVSLDAKELLFAHPEETEGRILVACYYRERPTPWGPRMSMRREAASLIVPGSGIDDQWVEDGTCPAYQGLTECDRYGRPVFNNACYLMAMRLLPTVADNAWAEDFFMVFDSRDSRIIEVATRLSDFNAYTQNNDDHFARMVADYVYNRMKT